MVPGVQPDYAEEHGLLEAGQAAALSPAATGRPGVMTRTVTSGCTWTQHWGLALEACQSHVGV